MNSRKQPPVFPSFDEDEPMVSSPPRVGASPPKSLSTILFANEPSEKASNRRRFTPRRQPSLEHDSILRPLDLNSTSSAGSGSSLFPRRKRPSDLQPPGRESAQWEDSDEEMFQSPRSSPNSYRTVDGRIVTSRNPFSPYTPMDEASAASPITKLKTAPNFPVYLHQATPSHISLQQRTSQFRQTYYGPSKSGYPDQHGRYSFTGSPIEEVDISLQSNNNKIRRLHQNDITKSRRTYHSGMYINTNLACTVKDEISPTDVSSFPPPTPMKKERYTPLRSMPPQTPALEHRQRGRRSGDDDEGISIESVSQHESKSRLEQDFDIIGHLGNGSFGTVYKCLSRLDGCMYAVKAAKRKAKGVADRDRMLKEVYALAALSDQADTAAFHIVRYHQAWMEENRLYIQTELCSFTLDAEMSSGPLSVERRYKLLREILVACEFIHRNGMVHLDIKPENIFVKNDQYKLGDFGLVSATHNNNDVEEGDSRYMSMELLSGDHSDLTKSDIFSLGATMYEICRGQALPMDGQEWQDIRAGTLLPLPDTPFALETIIKVMMHPDPCQRPQPAELLRKDELLSDEQKQLLAEKQKVLEANLALALQTERMKKLTPPRAGGLMRANTWNGSLPKWL